MRKVLLVILILLVCVSGVSAQGFIYAGGGTGKVWKINPSTMTKVGESDSYGGTIYALTLTPPPTLFSWNTVPIKNIATWNSATIGSWNTALWQAMKRYKFTIDHTKIDADLSWFPVTVFLTSSQGEKVFTEFDADEDFDRIAFTSSDGVTQLYADCELFDVSEQKAIYHVSKTGWTVSSSADTDIYLYYDNTADHNTTYISKSGGTAAQSVWDANFEAVYHMADNTTSTIVDSTSNANHGTKKAANEPIEATGQVGKGQDFDGTDDYIEIPDFSLFDGLNDFTVEAIVNADSVPASDDWKNAPIILSFRGEGGYQITYDDSASNPDRLSSRANLSVSGWTTLVESTRQSIDTDYFHATTFDTTNGWVWYENGSSQDTNANTESFVSSSDANYIGWTDSGTNRHFNGLLDEVRISSTARSAAWIGATYSTLWDNLLTYSAEETAPTGEVTNVLFIFSNF